MRDNVKDPSLPPKRQTKNVKKVAFKAQRHLHVHDGEVGTP